MKKQLPQEGLKCIACLSMLLDHAAVVLGGSLWFRAVGRLAFPIYCFLLAEGMAHTHSPKGYFLRLALAAAVSEAVYDLVLYPGRPLWQQQNVLWTLLLGALLLFCLQRRSDPWQRLAILTLSYFAAELLRVSYGGPGILLIALFGLTRGKAGAPAIQALGLLLISLSMNSLPISLLDLSVPVQLFAILAMVPISLYSGQKRTHSPLLSWGFYLFYPVHLLLLRGAQLLYRLS